MGGDGGTISSNRTYLRGAGKACHTADHPSNALKRSKLEDAERARLVLGTCAISGAVLELSPARKNGGTVSGMDLVVCPYGKLYKREKVLEALLQRSQTGGGDDGKGALGSHIRGMKDLHPVRFHITTSSSQGSNNGNASSDRCIAACPITGSEIGSGNVPSYVIVRTKSKDKKRNTDEEDEVAKNPNVLSERAIKEMGVEGLQIEYGPFEENDMIRLAPPKTGGVFEEVQMRWLTRVEEERIAKLQKKKEKKRKRGDTTDIPKKASKSPSTKPSAIRHNKNNNHNGGNGMGGRKSAVDEARSTVQAAVAQNAVLSNLFGVGKKKKKQTDREKRDQLFTRNC